MEQTKMNYKDDKHFFLYRIRGKPHLAYIKSLEKNKLDEIFESDDESLVYHRFLDFGSPYLRFLRDSKELGLLKKIVRINSEDSKPFSSILKYVFVINKEKGM